MTKTKFNIIDVQNKINEHFNTEFADKILNEVDKPDYLYHYTSQAKLLKILKKGSLLCSHVSFLNDPNEIHFGYKVILHLIKTSHQLGSQSHVFNILKEEEGKYFSDHYLFYSSPIFIFSFSAERDSLSQWGLYGDGGYGAAIEFIRSKLPSLINETLHDDKHNNTSYAFLPVNYYSNNYHSTSGNTKIFENCIIDYLHAMEEVIESINGQDDQGLRRIVVNYAVFLSTLIKNEFFKNENEWRLVLKCGPGNKNINAIDSERSLKLIYEILFHHKPDREHIPKQSKIKEVIEGIIIGPKNFGDHRIINALKIFTYRNLASDINVTFSEGVIRVR